VNAPSIKLSSVIFLSVSESVGNKKIFIIDRFNEDKHAEKKLLVSFR
jgi:hypothetical protein